MNFQSLVDAVGQSYLQYSNRGIVLLTVLLGSICCSTNAISQSIESASGPTTSLGSENYKIEFRNQSDPSMQSMQGFHKIPLTDLASELALSDKQVTAPSEIKTRVKLVNDSLVGFSNLRFPSEYADKDYTLAPFSPGVSNDASSLEFADSSNVITPALYYDRDGNAVFRVSDQPIDVLWSLKGEPTPNDPSRRIFHLHMPTAPKCKLELTLDSQFELSSSSIPSSLKQDANANSRTWELECGMVEDVRLIITDLQLAASRNEGVFGSEQIDWIVQSFGLELNASFVFDSTLTPKQLMLSVDPRVRVRTITWDQQAIDWTFDRRLQTISLNVPSGEGTYAGTQHRLVVNGVAEWNLGESEPNDALHELPKIQLSSSLALEGRGSISLHSDWELINFSANNANLVSRSGTTVRGGISRLDFNWRLSRPDFAIKLLRRKRLRTANVMMFMTSDRNDAVTTAKIRLNAESEAWSVLPLVVGNGWRLENCEIENAPNFNASMTKDQDAQVSNVVISPPVENQIIELSLRLRGTVSSNESSQNIELPQTIPFVLKEVNQTTVLEYLPISGYALERSVDLAHEVVSFAKLDTWHRSQISARDHAIELNLNNDLLAVARFVRQRPGIATRSILYVNKSWGATQCDYLLECTPDQAGIQTLDLRLPTLAKNLIWRILSKDKKEIQGWTWPELTQANDPEEKPFKDASLVCDHLLLEPFILECQYLLPSQLSDISLPQVANLVNRNSYILTESDFQIQLSSDQRHEDTLTSDELIIRPDEQNADIRNLISFLERPIGIGVLYEIASQNVTFRIEASIQSPKVIVADHSVETLYCQSDRSLLYELELGRVDLNDNALSVSLPNTWKVMSASSDEEEFQYIIREIGDRIECEIERLSENNKAISSLKLRWLGPSVNLERGIGSIPVPDFQGNFQSISHTSKILVHDNFLVPLQSSNWSQLALQNLHTLSMPWTWSRDFLFQSIQSPTSTDNAGKNDRLGYSELRSPIVQGSFRNFSVNEVKKPSILTIVNRRFILLLRWFALAVSFIVATLLMRYSAWLAPWVASAGLLTEILTIETELIVATAMGLILAIIVQLAHVIMRKAAVNQNLAIQESKDPGKRPSSGLRQKTFLATGIVRAVLVCLTFQNCLHAQGPDSLYEPQATNQLQTNPTIVVPIDANSLKIAPYAWISDRANPSVNQTRETSAGPELLSAQHVLECKKNQDVLFKFPQKVLITSTYRFRFNDDVSSISLPFNISNVIDQFSVDGKVLTYGQNFFYSNSGLVWKSQRSGEFTIKLRTLLRQSTAEGITVARAEVLPCAASQVSILTDVSDLSLMLDGRPSEIDRSQSTYSIGNFKELALRWRSEATASSVQYDAETRVFLDQSQPIAVTRIHVVGAMNRKSDLTLEWNRNWKPVGESFRDATKRGTPEIWNIDYQRCGITMRPSQKLEGGVADLEIYWQPVNESLTTLAVPDPRIIEAIPNVRSLRYAKNSKSIWSVVGTDAWTPITSGSSSSLAMPNANLTNTTLLRIPDNSAAAILQNNFASQEKVNVQVQSDYLIGSSSSSIHWRGSLVPSYVRTKTQSWVVDKRLTIDSVKINNQDALFAVDRLSENLNLVRAIGDFEGELLSSVEIVARTAGSISLANNTLPLINWCNVKVIQSGFTISRLAGLPVSVENLPSNVAIDGKLFPLNDANLTIPFAEKIAEGFESVPYELERPQIQNDQSTITQILQTISERNLAQVTTRASFPEKEVIRCQAGIALHNDVWRLDFNCELESTQEGHGLVLALPVTDAVRLKSKSSITKLAEIGDAAYLYVAADRDFSDETRLHRISFWIDQRIDSTKTTFDIPEIDFMSAPLMRCDLNVSYGTQKQDLIWDVSHWTKQDTSNLEHEEATHASGNQLSRYVSVGKIAAIHAEPKPSKQINLQFPFAYWNLQSADDENLVLEALLAIIPQGTATATLEMPNYLRDPAFMQLAGDGFESADGWILPQNKAGVSGQIPIRFRATELPQLIVVRGTVTKASLERIEITDHDFRIKTADGKTIIPARSNFGLSTDCDAVAAESTSEAFGVSNAVAMQSLTGELLGLLQDAKPNIDRLTATQRNDYLSSWCRLIQEVGTAEIPNGGDVSESDWIEKYRLVFANAHSLHAPKYIPTSLTDRASIYWRSMSNSAVKLERRRDNVDQAFAYDLITLLSWSLPLVLTTFVLLPIASAEQIRTILRDYPWRFLCLLALGLAILPNLLWLSLLLSCIALAICIVAFNRQYFSLN